MRRALIPAILIFAFASPAAAQGERTVKRIEFEGLRLHSADEILRKMEIREGKPWSDAVFDSDRRRLYGTGWFSRFEKSPRCIFEGPDAVVLVVEVLENDVVREIRFNGNRQFNDEEISENSHLKAGEYFSEFRMSMDANRIRDRYLEEGYAFVKVDTARSAGEKGVVATFTIREGPRARVRGVELHGLRQLTRSKARRVVSATAGTFLGNLFSPPVYKAQELARDVERLARYAQSEGYLDARVYLKELEWNEDRTRVTAHVQVEEGIQYIVDSMEIEGNRIIATEELMRGLLALPGEPCALKNVERDEDALIGKYRDAAYVDADVQLRQTVLGDRPGRVKLVWRIREGEKVYVSRIDFFGNSRTREKVLRRQMRLFPGDELNVGLLNQSMNRLKGLGYFEAPGREMLYRSWIPARDPDGIIVVECLPGEEKNVRDLFIHVQEGRTGNFQFGGTYSDAAGVSGFLRVTQRNFDLIDLPGSLAELFTGEAFAGGGQIMSINLQPGNRRSLYSVSFTEPWFLNLPMSLSLSGSSYDRDRRFYRDRRITGSAGLSWHWEPPPMPRLDFAEGVVGTPAPTSLFTSLLHGFVSIFEHIPVYSLIDDLAIRQNSIARFWQRGWFVGADYSFSRIQISEIDHDAPSDVFDVEGLSYLSAVSLRVGFEHVDNPGMPSRGVISEVSYRHAGYPLGGDWDFWRYDFVNRSFTTLFVSKTGGKTVFSTEIRGAFAQEHYYTEEVPIFERLYLGGTGSFRGFETTTISPKDRDEPIGGNVLAFAGAEVSFPLVRLENGPGYLDFLRGVVFTDWGTVVESGHDFGHFRWSVGFGFRINVLGLLSGGMQAPVSVDFGFPLKMQEDDERQTVHVGFDFGF
ncbi:MAG: outer membrane protein assembly factor [Planctomycetes bacterium]|nr:outer membrane protein assembly factor [Planctomycetota bacterium]